MNKCFCDICKQEKKGYSIQTSEEMLTQVKEWEGEHGFYRAIKGHFDFKRVEHVCTDCREKILRIIFDHYHTLIDPIFEDSKTSTVDVKTCNVTTDNTEVNSWKEFFDEQKALKKEVAALKVEVSANEIGQKMFEYLKSEGIRINNQEG